MKVYCPRPDFVIVEDFFSAGETHEWLTLVVHKGSDPVRGLHHPDLRPNRFHARPKYPVKKFMCFGLYWDPMTYRYTPLLPEWDAPPHPLPEKLKELSLHVLERFFPWDNYSPESALVNFYTADSSMGLHVDKDEEDHDAPVIGLNFGSTCRFFFEDEHQEMKDIKIPGNSLYIFGKSARMMRHGLGTIYTKTLSKGSESFLKDKERVNITIRQVYLK